MIRNYNNIIQEKIKNKNKAGGHHEFWVVGPSKGGKETSRFKIYSSKVSSFKDADLSL